MPRPNPAYPNSSPFPNLDDNGNPIPIIPGQTAPNASSPTGAAVSTTNPTVNPTVSVPTPQNIDPNASVQPAAATTPPATTAPTTGPQTVAGVAASNQATQGGQNPPVLTGTGAQGMFTPDDLTRQNAAAVQQANLNVAAAWEQIKNQQDVVNSINAIADPAAYTAASNTLDTLYNKLTSAEQNLQTANVAYGNAIDKAIIDPTQADLQSASAAKARADANQAQTTADTLAAAAPGQRALVAAQAGAASAQAASDQANADATALKAGPEADQLRASANNLQSQADQTRALIGTPDNPGPLIQKAQAEVGLTTAQTGLTGSESDYYKAQAASSQADATLKGAQADYQKALTAAGGPAATVAETQARGAQEQATAEATRAGVQQNLLGTLYGLPEQTAAVKAAINSIAGQVFGPGGSGSEDDANQLLQQFITARIGGTTPYAASVATQNAQQNQYATQGAMYNQAAQAAASRANAYAGMAGGMLGTLEQMNQYAPKGSNLLGPAFNDVLNMMTQRMGGQQAMAPPVQPQAPALPPFLQGFAAGHQAGTAQATTQGQGQAAPTINVNVNGQPATGAPAPAVAAPAAAPAAPATPGAFNPQASTAAMNAAGYMDNPAGRAAMAAGNPSTAAPNAQTPAQAFQQGLANNQPQFPNYLQGLVDPRSMIASGQGLLGGTGGLLQPTATAGSLGTPANGAFVY